MVGILTITFNSFCKLVIFFYILNCWYYFVLNILGIPKGVINVVTSDRPNAPTVGKELCESPLIAGLSFTGKT